MLNIFIVLIILLSQTFSAYGLGGQDNNQELAKWYEQAYSYYVAVQSGVEPQPEPRGWNEFLNQMQWAFQQLYGDDKSQRDPFGGKVGPNGNVIYNLKKVHIVYTGDSRTHDIYSRNIILDVPYRSAKVTIEQTQDRSISPPKKVLKIVVKDPITGKEAVYYIHNFSDIEIKINTPDSKNIRGKPPNVKIGKFRYTKPASLITLKKKR